MACVTFPFCVLVDNDQRGSDALKGMPFAVFGLGCSQTYPDRYQAVGKRLDQRLEQLGANRLLERGEGDDSGYIEDNFHDWKTEALPQLMTILKGSKGTDVSGGEVNVSPWSPPFVVTLYDAHNIPTHRPKASVEGEKLATKFTPLRVLENRELYGSAVGRSCRHIALNLEHTDLTYESGDHIGVMPENTDTAVSRLGRALSLDIDQYFDLRIPPGDGDPNRLNTDYTLPVYPDSRFPVPITLRTAFKHYLDITGPVSMSHIGALAPFAMKASEQQEMIKLSTDSKSHKDQVTSRFVTWPDLFELFQSLAPPVGVLLDLIPPLQPRYYSVSSSHLMHPDQIHLTIGVHDVEAAALTDGSNRRFYGLASTWLSRRPERDVFTAVPVTVRTSTFKQPVDLSTPVVYVGAGTGYAPLRSFVQDRIHIVEHDPETAAGLGEAVLYFGCQHRSSSESDWMYADEMLHAERIGAVQRLRTAFAADQPDLIFVQHLMKEDKEYLWDLIHRRKGCIYVCGSAKLIGAGVQSTLVDILAEMGKMGRYDAEEFKKNMLATSQLQLDVF
eukprot:TRINITY_DN2774_c0_g1_i5.p1 TRINITY_DN2774_c0_g1~~TRINITY_DN2774_c0_g1_i5.p1  ORF type:complete len:558 (-),score=90.31 TRINITY_DN2774_c0_g1_i5:86-1759(-)